MGKIAYPSRGRPVVATAAADARRNVGCYDTPGLLHQELFMSRERTAWTVSVMVIGLLAFQLPGSLAQRDDDYAWIRTLVDVHRYVADNYVDTVDEEKLRQGAIKGMLDELDPYTIYVPPAKEDDFRRMLGGSFRGVGIELTQDPKTLIVEVVSPIEGSPAFRAGVLAGDVILQVNGEDVAGMRIDDISNKIKGPVGTEVSLTVKHVASGMETLTMTRQDIVVPTVRGLRRNPNNAWEWFVNNEPKIAYVRITQFTEDTFAKLEPLMKDLLKEGMQGLIIDLRWNPGGELSQAEKVVDLFVRDGVIVTTRGVHQPEEVAMAHDEGTLPDFPMVVLVNEYSASASEIVAGSLKDNHRALVLGARTFGKGSVQSVIGLDGDRGQLKLTVAYYYLPSGRLVHKKEGATDWGVEPQIGVAMDEATGAAIYQQMESTGHFRRPYPADATTRPATLPTTQATDTQLEAAVSTLIGHIVLQTHRQQDKSPATKPASP